MARQKQIVAKRQQAARRRARRGCSSTVHRPTTSWCCAAGWRGQAPDIDPQVYLTDCDPATLRAGDFVDVEIVGAHGYDLDRQAPVAGSRRPLGGAAAPSARLVAGGRAARRPSAAPGERRAVRRHGAASAAHVLHESPVEVWETRVGLLPTFCVLRGAFRRRLGWQAAEAGSGGSLTPLERIREIAGRVAGAYGLLIDEVAMRREGRQHVLRVVLDRPGPAATPEDSVSIADCERVSHELGTILDVEDLLPDSLHAGGFVARAGSAASRRRRLRAVRRAAREDRHA